MKTILTFAEDSHVLKKLLFELDLLNFVDPLSIFIRGALATEMKFYCQARAFMSVIGDGITRYDNLRLNKLGVSCTTKNPTVVTNYQYSLLPSIFLNI